ncbi:MAG: NgoFVII family restriction endonuclease, partial [Candidatus Cloacimonetes bacterium]|nr:NgoFVII family restriction endonuclease [Candidatus Cloacimonadota bacterium]MDY0230835.1 hypothetical protein [Candidatus Cloacimonadaceae bacterium]
GLDIPELDMVMFLRPTQSPIVFLQQLGRGLRKSRGKNYVNVLDFIGNYKKANLVPFWLNSETGAESSGKSGYRLPTEDDYPVDCLVDFDFKLIDLFKKMARDQKKITDRVVDEFYRIQDEYDKRPLRLELYVHLDNQIYKRIISRTEINIFKDYLRFLDEIGETTAEEKELLGTVAHEFLKIIESTDMNKTYKMPILLAFYNGGEMKLAINDDDIYQSFKAFFADKTNLIDLLRDKGSADAESWGRKEYLKKAKESPIKWLSKNKDSSVYFYQKEGRFCLNPELATYFTNPAFVKHFKDIIDYRTKRFYKERLEKLENTAAF